MNALRRTINTTFCVLGGAGLGAGLMYLFDPDRGRRRRVMLRDQFTTAVHEAGDALDKGLRDMNNRVSGALIETVSLFTPDNVSDEVMTNRVRSALGRCSSYPHAIEVHAHEGHVLLSGDVLHKERDRIIHTVFHVKGVRTVNDIMTGHDQPGRVPDMQGRPRPLRPRLLVDTRSTPARRLGVAVAGSFVAAFGMGRRGIIGAGAKGLGIAMLLRALKRPPQHSFAGDSELELGVDMQKTINVDAPLENVFNMLANPENFPRFMSHVHQVKSLGDGVFRWTVIGPAGTLARWDAEILKVVPNELLEWKTTPGSMVEHAGVVRFDPTPYGGSRVHVRLSFRPPAGPLGKALAEFFSVYPKQMLDEDLARFKSLMEQGKTTAHHHKIVLEEVAAR